MIEDAHERTRAILWLLADLEPGMPLLEALGYLKAVEQRLESERAAGGAVPLGGNPSSLIPRYRGGAGIPNLVRDMASDRLVVAQAKRGDKGETARQIARVLGPGKVGATEALLAAGALVNMYAPEPDDGDGRSGGMLGGF